MIRAYELQARLAALCERDSSGTTERVSEAKPAKVMERIARREAATRTSGAHAAEAARPNNCAKKTINIAQKAIFSEFFSILAPAKQLLFKVKYCKINNNAR
jgi:hypothetical protein